MFQRCAFRLIANDNMASAVLVVALHVTIVLLFFKAYPTALVTRRELNKHPPYRTHVLYPGANLVPLSS